MNEEGNLHYRLRRQTQTVGGVDNISSSSDLLGYVPMCPRPCMSLSLYVPSHYMSLSLRSSSSSGKLRTQKLKSHLVITQSSNVLPLKPGVGQYVVIHATLTARDFFLTYFYPFRSIHLHFFPKPLPIFSCVGCG